MSPHIASQPVVNTSRGLPHWRNPFGVLFFAGLAAAFTRATPLRLVTVEQAAVATLVWNAATVVVFLLVTNGRRLSRVMTRLRALNIGSQALAPPRVNRAALLAMVLVPLASLLALPTAGPAATILPFFAMRASLFFGLALLAREILMLALRDEDPSAQRVYLDVAGPPSQEIMRNAPEVVDAVEPSLQVSFAPHETLAESVVDEVAECYDRDEELEDLEEIDELDELDEQTPFDRFWQTPGALQWQTRQVATDGVETIEGTMSVDFVAGQKSAVLHWTFCPPLRGMPTAECVSLDGADVELNVAAIFSYGMRIEARRRDPDAEESLRIGFVVSARSSNSGRANAA